MGWDPFEVLEQLWLSNRIEDVGDGGRLAQILEPNHSKVIIVDTSSLNLDSRGFFEPEETNLDTSPFFIWRSAHRVGAKAGNLSTHWDTAHINSGQHLSSPCTLAQNINACSIAIKHTWKHLSLSLITSRNPHNLNRDLGKTPLFPKPRSKLVQPTTVHFSFTNTKGVFTFSRIEFQN